MSGSRNKTIAVVGRGIAGLSIATLLKSRGTEVVSVASDSDLAASECALGASMVKGVFHPRTPLFRAKFLGHRNLSAFLEKINRIISSEVSWQNSGVVEPCFSFADYQAVRKRIYRRNFFAPFSAELVKFDELEKIECLDRSIVPKIRCAFFYPNDGYLDASRLLAEMRTFLRQSCRYFRTQRLTKLSQDLQGWRMDLVESKPIHVDEVVLACGAGTNPILKNSDLPEQDLLTVPGISCQGPNPGWKPGVYTKWKSTLVITQHHFCLGSLAPTPNPELAFRELAKMMFGFELPMRSLQIIEGERVRTSNRMPLIERVASGKKGDLWVFSGLYKSGFELVSNFAESFVKSLSAHRD